MSAASDPTARLPAETDPHECCVVAWPTARRTAFWRGHLEEARQAYAATVAAVAAFEPVLVVADEGEAGTARQLVPTGVEVIELPIDDSWIRDSGPLVVVDPSGRRVAVDFRFNAWGRKFPDHARDDAVAGRLAAHLGLPVQRRELVLEGGSVASDGRGLLVTTSRCLEHPNRNPSLGREAIERELREALGASTVIWLPDALSDDDGTDGHVDNVVSFVGPGRCLLQGCDDPADPDLAVATTNRRLLREAGIAVVDLPTLPRVACFDATVEVPYANLYVANGGVVVPTTGHEADDDALAIIAACFPGREVVAVPGAVLAFGGGGVHCITMQIPAGS